MSKSSSTPRAKRTIKRATAKNAKGAAKTASSPRTESKQSQLIAMLKQPDGATIAEVVETLAWQPHTVRGAIAGALKKKLGLKVESDKVDDRGRVYRIIG
jgi:hypothetical protein